MQPATRPNYALRRVVALVLVGLVALGVIRFVAALGSDTDGAPPSETGVDATTTSDPTPDATRSELQAPPACVVGDTITDAALVEDWQRSIVDTELRLPADYVPSDLVSASLAGFEERFRVRDVAIDDLAALRAAAADNGTPIELIAAYRSVAEQQDLFARREAELGFEAAAARTARPGHSEHHLGTAVDFKTAGADDVFQSWADEPAGRFVLENAHRFGFVLSYPAGGEERTCYDFEPWHHRYVGVDLATRVHESGLTLREYLWHWQETGDEPTV